MGERGQTGQGGQKGNEGKEGQGGQGGQEERRRYPKVAEAVPIEVMLGASDMLYIPPGWWHHVEGMTPTAAVLLPFDMVCGEYLHPSLLLS